MSPGRQPAEPRPQQPDQDKYETDPDEPSAHDPTPKFRIFVMTPQRKVALIHVNASVACECSFARQQWESRMGTRDIRRTS